MKTSKPHNDLEDDVEMVFAERDTEVAELERMDMGISNICICTPLCRSMIRQCANCFEHEAQLTQATGRYKGEPVMARFSFN
jgi:hypothetical protein